jgi:hypothetical protein
MWIVKVRRCLRRIPRVALARLVEPIFNAGQILTFAAAVIGLALYLRLDPTPIQRDALATEWAIGIEAFLLALIGWAALSLLLAPFIVVRHDRRRGRWHGHHFTYREPLLVTTQRFEEKGGRTQRRRIHFDDAEPNGFAYYTIELIPKAQGRVGVWVTGGSPPADFELDQGWITPSGQQHLGTRLPKDRAVTMFARLKPETVPVICRLWCHSFHVGKSG